jgi:NitT/TauT family transport system ATP-binding protein
MSLVEVTDIFQSYGGRPILERVSVEAEEGEFVSIVGASGCGKSTFLRLLLDQERPTRGGITVDGEPLKGEPDRSRGIVFQRYSVFPHLSVRDNIVAAEGLSRPLGRLFGSVKRAARARADEALERIGLSMWRTSTLGSVGGHAAAAGHRAGAGGQAKDPAAR